MKGIALRAFLCLLSFIWVYALYIFWQQDSQTKRIENGEINASEFKFIPFADKPLHSSIEKQLVSGNFDFDFVENQILLLQDYRPLFAPGWLQLAQLYLQQGNRQLALENAHFAEQLWNNRSYHLYKVASFWIKVGDVDNAIRTLGRYVITDPENIFATLQMSRLLSQDPLKMLTQLYYEDNRILMDAQNMHQKIFDYALKQEDAGLAQVTWEKFDTMLVNNERLVGRYINFLISQNNSVMALKVWNAFSPVDITDKITNHSFEQELSRLGFGWNIQEGKEFSWDIDEDIFFQGSKSLKLAFDGNHNIDFQHIRQIIPVEPGATYRFSGYWRGTGVSTLSTPYIELTPMYANERLHVRTKPNKGNWGWEKFEEFIEMPLQSNFLRLRIRRNKSQALDKFISGSIWFDEFELEKMPDDRLGYTHSDSIEFNFER